jgi:chemotaxis protein MotB
MSADASQHNRRRRRRSSSHGEHENDERWLLTYSDMITLLMALFIVMWAISSVNQSKFAALRQSLRQAFAGKLTQGGESVLNGGAQVLQAQGARISPIATPRQEPAKIAANKYSSVAAAARAVGQTAAAASDLESLRALARQIEHYARRAGLGQQIATSLDERGLVVRLLTDKMLFDSGQAVVKEEGRPLLTRIAQLIETLRIPNPIRVEGNTDAVPISTYQYPSNWELSAARATAVLEVLLQQGVPDSQVSVAGYADQNPIASNSTAQGRHHNRRVEIVVLRRGTRAAGGS